MCCGSAMTIQFGPGAASHIAVSDAVHENGSLVFSKFYVRIACFTTRLASQFVSGHAGYLNELNMPSSFVVFSFPFSTSSQIVHNDFPRPDVL